jgi:hypothetical protein
MSRTEKSYQLSIRVSLYITIYIVPLYIQHTSRQHTSLVVFVTIYIANIQLIDKLLIPESFGYHSTIDKTTLLSINY